MTNNELKYLSNLKRKKYREKEKKFLIEGSHLVEEILRSPARKELLSVFIRSGYDDTAVLQLLKAENVPVEKMDAVSFAKISDTENPQGIIGLVNIPGRIRNSKSIGSLCIALDNINDPGNLGTILRTCYWFNTDEILISSNSVELYNPKVIRASQGAVFNLNIYEGARLDEELQKRHKEGWNIFLTDLDAKSFLSKTTFEKKSKYVFVFGNEANGISPGILASKDYQRIKIRSFSSCESLNIAISLGIVLNEFRTRA